MAIDQREVHRLGLLLEQVFENVETQMVTTVIGTKGIFRSAKFRKVEEYLFVLTFGGLEVSPWMRTMLDPIKGDKGATTGIEWLGLRRGNPKNMRSTRKNQFYPIFVEIGTQRIHSIGQAIPLHIDRTSVQAPVGTEAIWPLRPDGTEMLWGLTPQSLQRNWQDGFVRVSPKGTVQYLPTGTIQQIRDGAITLLGRGRDGSVRGTKLVEDEYPKPKRVWHVPSHNAELGGTRILSKLIPGRQFPYAKSVYAVEDALRFFIGDNPSALVLDFFAGSGTTAHAVMRLNRQDGGSRRSILVTNNEVSAEEVESLRGQGLRPGDQNWERLGICEYITKPRIRAAVTGVTWDGNAVQGKYGYTDEFPMSDGFKENVEFFTLGYEEPWQVAHNRAFEVIAPLLWMRAGSMGRRINIPCDDYDVADTYAVLFDLDASQGFLAAVKATDTVRIAFIVTDDEQGFQTVCSELPARLETVRLYESYLTNFTINTRQV